MTPQMVVAIRWFFLIGALLSLLQATILFDVFQRVVIQPWFRLNERLGASVPRMMSDQRFQRGWPALMAIVFAVIWWVTGTPAGQAWLLGGGR